MKEFIANVITTIIAITACIYAVLFTEIPLDVKFTLLVILVYLGWTISMIGIKKDSEIKSEI